MTEKLNEKSRFELFSENAKENISDYRKKLFGDGSFDYVNQVLELNSLSKKLNQRLLSYWFGDQLGLHLAEKFVYESNRNFLDFLGSLTSEYRFFILYELKNNKDLFAYA